MSTTTRIDNMPCARYLAAALALSLAGCATQGPQVYDNEEFTTGNTYSRSFPGSGATVCEAARRALLSQGYIISESKPALVKGSKNFQRSKDSHAEIEFNIVCAPDSDGSNATTAFANAVRQSYSLKKSSNSASVGVGVLGSLSVPFGLSDDALVKVGAETIDSKKFYDQFFTRVESYLDTSAVEPADAASDKPAPVSPDLPKADATKSDALRAEALQPALRVDGAPPAATPTPAIGKPAAQPAAPPAAQSAPAAAPVTPGAPAVPAASAAPAAPAATPPGKVPSGN